MASRSRPFITTCWTMSLGCSSCTFGPTMTPRNSQRGSVPRSRRSRSKTRITIALAQARATSNRCFRLHQARSAEPRQPAFAHHRAAQGADAGHRKETDAAQEIDREQAGEERPVEPVHRRRAQPDIEAAPALVAVERRRSADVLARLARVHEGVAQRGHIAKAQVEALR